MYRLGSLSVGIKTMQRGNPLIQLARPKWSFHTYFQVPVITQAMLLLRWVDNRDRTFRLQGDYTKLIGH